MLQKLHNGVVDNNHSEVTMSPIQGKSKSFLPRLLLKDLGQPFYFNGMWDHPAPIPFPVSDF